MAYMEYTLLEQRWVQRNRAVGQLSCINRTNFENGLCLLKKNVPRLTFDQISPYSIRKIFAGVSVRSVKFEKGIDTNKY